MSYNFSCPGTVICPNTICFGMKPIDFKLLNKILNKLFLSKSLTRSVLILLALTYQAVAIGFIIFIRPFLIIFFTIIN
jgi:hypothetical protein